MKYTLTFLLIAFLNVFVSAQKENTAFLETQMITWLDTEISTFEKAIKTAEEAHDSNDFTKIGNSKSDLLKGLKRFSNNCDVLYNQIAKDREEIAIKEQVNDVMIGHDRYMRKKSQSRLQELYVTQEGENKLQIGVKEIKLKYAEIQKRNSDFFPSQKNTPYNLADAKEILAAAQDINAIIQKGIISE